MAKTPQNALKWPELMNTSYWSLTLVGIGTLEFTLVPASVRPFQEFSMTIHLYFSELLHGVTTLYGRKCNILGFLKIILVASPGALLWLKKPKNALKWLKMTLFAL